MTFFAHNTYDLFTHNPNQPLILSKIITNPTYNKLRGSIWNLSNKIPFFRNKAKRFLKRTEGSLKNFLTPGGLFEELGLRYIGPVDGHDLNQMIKTFQAVKDMNSTVIVHVYTKKGKGSSNAELDSEKYYSVSENQNAVLEILGNVLSITPNSASIAGLK